MSVKLKSLNEAFDKFGDITIISDEYSISLEGQHLVVATLRREVIEGILSILDKAASTFYSVDSLVVTTKLPPIKNVFLRINATRWYNGVTTFSFKGPGWHSLLSILKNGILISPLAKRCLRSTMDFEDADNYIKGYQEYILTEKRLSTRLKKLGVLSCKKFDLIGEVE